MPTLLARPASLLVCVLVFVGAAGAEHHFLVMGGGGRPSGNQVSLEKNVQYFGRVLDRLGLADAPRSTLFACGDSDIDDLVYLQPAGEAPDIRVLLAKIIGPSKGVNEFYRPHEVGGGERPSTKKQIASWFDHHADRLDADDALLVYFTGHGGKAKGDMQDTSIYLWNGGLMRMTEFAEHLDKLDPELPVVMVMVQCYGGGFANTVFKEGDPAKGLTGHNRCGFYATVHDRTAAGCTPHVNEVDYREYSSYFWAALCGEDRLGEPIDPPDYNGDGRVGYDEAHAYAMITSDAVDVSMTTSDRLVRHYSRTKPAEDDTHGYTTADADYADLIAAGSNAQRAILEGLSERLQLTTEQRTAEARELAKNLETEKMKVRSNRRELAKELRTHAKATRSSLLKKWPQLRNPWHPQVVRILNEQEQAVRQTILKHKSYKAFAEVEARMEALGREAEVIDAQITRCRRFIYTAESIALAANLPHCASPDVVEAHAQLLARESASLTQ